MRRLLHGMMSALLGLSALAANAIAAPGDLDPSFDGDGRVIFELGDMTVSPSDMLLQPDGKIVTLAATPARISPAESSRDLLVVRFNPDGSLDTSFNRVGYKLLALNGQAAVAGGLALQSDGKLIISGATAVSAGNQDFLVVRLNADGSFDNAFGTQGSTTVSFDGSVERAWRAAVQGDGNIVVAGESDGAGTTDFAITRLTAAGTLDASFGAQGKVLIDSQIGAIDALSALLIQSDGKIVAAGSAGPVPSRPFIVRLNADGSLDTGFDSDGRFLPVVQPTFLSAGVNAIAQQSDGKLLAAGYAFSNFGPSGALMRLAADGSVDAPITLLDTGGFTALPLDLALEPGGSFLVGGVFQSAPAASGFVTRFSSFGSPDLSFSSGGTSFITAGRDNVPLNFYAARLARQQDGRIVVLGGSVSFDGTPEPSAYRRLMLARLGPGSGSSPGTLGLTDRTGSRTVDEGALDQFSVARTGGAAGAVSVTYTLTPITATSGTDFPALTGTFTWADGESGSQSVGYRPFLDGEYESTHEELQIVLSSFTGGATPGMTTRRVFIRSMDPAPTPRVSMNRPTIDKHEEAEIGNVNVFWTSWNLAGVTASVDYSVILGTAVNGLDTVVSNGTLILTNASSGNISIPNIVDATDEAIKTFTVRLSNPTGGVTIDQADTVVSLIDNDPPPFIEMKESSRTVTEASTSVTLTVTRTAHSAGELSVSYATEAGTATTSDFVATSGTLLWAANDYTPRTFTVTLSPDTAVEGTESFSVVLSNQTTGATLGHARTTVTITDDDVAAPPNPGGGGGGGGGGGPFDLLSLLACGVLLSRWILSGARMRS